MGQTVVDAQWLVDRAHGSGVNIAVPAEHQGTPPINNVAPSACTMAQITVIKDAALQGQSDFNTACANVWGSWYTSLSTATQTDLRDNLLALRAALL